MVSFKLGQSTRTTKQNLSPLRKIQEMQFGNLLVFVPFFM